MKDPSKFQERARSRATTPTKDAGGELGFIDRPVVDPAFAEAAFAEGLTTDQVRPR